MPDSVITEAAGSIVDFDIIGAMFVLTLGALVFAVKQWIDAKREVNDEKDKRIEDVKAYASESAANRQVMESNTVAIRTMLDFVKGGS